MNGVGGFGMAPATGVAPVAPSNEQRLARKRQLTDELVQIRTQKAEVLRQIQAIAKRQKTGGLPTKAAELLAGNNKLVLQMEQRNRAEKIWVDCGKIMQDLLKNQQTKIYFGEPVRESYVPNYYQVIKNPMDLGTIKTKIDGRRYNNVYEFRDDVRLTFNNCRIFNPPGNHVRLVGDQTSERFEKKWAMSAIEYHWEAHIKQCALEDKQLELESKSLPDKLQEVTAELQELTRKVEAHGQALPPGPGREMTFEEKRKLSHAMGSLSGERLVHVLQIIAEGPSAPAMEDDDEYELDIDALDAETCWKLQAYVDSVLAAEAARLPGQAPPPAGAPAAAAGGTGAAPVAAPQPGAAAAPAGDGAQQAAGGAQPVADGAPARSSGSDSDEGVGSKGGAGSTHADQAAEAKQRLPAGGHDITTFVSATGPGAQTQILKNATQKKDVQLQNAGAWANLTAAPAAAPGAAAPAAPAAGAGGAGEGAAGGEDDHLWSEFQGREQQQLQAEEAKRAAEEAEKRRKEAEMEAMRREAAEAEARRQREAAEKEEAARRALEEQRQREQQQLQSMAAAAAADKDPDILRGAGGHDSAANLADLGLQAKDEASDEDDVPMEDI